MGMLAEILVSALLVVGGIFTLVGSYGLVKLDDLMKRLHAPTKATTVGVGACLLASMAYFGLIEDRLTFHELLVTIFLLLTAPITANMTATAHLHTAPETEATLPETGTDEGWATYDAAPMFEDPEATRED